MFKVSNKSGFDTTKVFLSGFLAGTICFLFIYGYKVLDPGYDGWIFNTEDRDIIQHYVGWCMYRISGWHAHIGLSDMITYPIAASVIWTDSIPIIAVILKLFRDFLPLTFQYIGIYGCISFALTGGISSVLIFKLTGRKVYSIIASVFFSIAPVFIYRMFYHTALASMWLILLSFFFWFQCYRKSSLIRKMVLSGLFGLIAVNIHAYIWMMCAIIILFSYINELWEDRKLLDVILPGLSFSLVTIASLVIMGAFYNSFDGATAGMGYEANLNSFINPMGHSLFLTDLPLVMNQYEGFAYLGFGMMVLIVALVIIFLRKRPAELFKRFGKKPLFLIIMSLVFISFSLLPLLSLNGNVVFDGTALTQKSPFLATFRANGRFLWPVYYMLITLVFFVLSGIIEGRRTLLAVLSVTLLIQMVDLFPVFAKKHAIYAAEEYDELQTELDKSPELEAVSGRYKHLVLVPSELPEAMELAYYAYRHGMSVNRFYLARGGSSRYDNVVESYYNDIIKGNTPEDFLFVLNDAVLEDYKGLGLHIYSMGKDRYIATLLPVEGLEETEPF